MLTRGRVRSILSSGRVRSMARPQGRRVPRLPPRPPPPRAEVPPAPPCSSQSRTATSSSACMKKWLRSAGGTCRCQVRQRHVEISLLICEFRRCQKSVNLVEKKWLRSAGGTYGSQVRESACLRAC